MKIAHPTSQGWIQLQKFNSNSNSYSGVGVDLQFNSNAGVEPNTGEELFRKHTVLNDLDSLCDYEMWIPFISFGLLVWPQGSSQDDILAWWQWQNLGHIFVVLVPHWDWTTCVTIFVHMTILIQRSPFSKFQIYISLSQCHCSPQVSVGVEPPRDESQAANVDAFSHRNESPMAWMGDSILMSCKRRERCGAAQWWVYNVGQW